MASGRAVIAPLLPTPLGLSCSSNGTSAESHCARSALRKWRFIGAAVVIGDGPARAHMASGVWRLASAYRGRLSWHAIVERLG